MSLIQYNREAFNISFQVFNYKSNFKNIWKTIFLKLFILERVCKKEKHWFVVPVIYAFIGCFLYVPWLKIKPAILMLSGGSTHEKSYPARAWQIISHTQKGRWLFTHSRKPVEDMFL